eukprot:gene4275-4529_t
MQQWEVAVYGMIVVLLVLGAGLMSGLTLGLLSLDVMDLQVLKASGSSGQHRSATRLIPLVARPHWLLCTLLLCNAACMEALPLFLDRLLDPVGAVLLSVSAILLFGEIIPQAVCSRFGVAIGARMAPLVQGLMWVTAVITWPLGKLLDFALGHADPVMKRGELRAMVQLHGETAGLGGKLTAEEVAVIQGAMDLTYKTALAAMTPMPKVFMLSDCDVLDSQLVQAVLQSGHSRVPVYRGSNRDDVIGLILVKELLQFWQAKDAPCVRQLEIRPMPHIPADTPMFDVLRLFQTGNSHMALLLAPKGTDYIPIGLITLEDVMEELMQREIVDETDAFMDNEQTEKVDLPRLMSTLPPHLHALLRAEMLAAAQNFVKHSTWTPSPELNPNHIRHSTAVRVSGTLGRLDKSNSFKSLRRWSSASANGMEAAGSDGGGVMAGSRLAGSLDGASQAGPGRVLPDLAGSGVLKLLQLDTCRDATALIQCAAKMQLSTSQYCSVQLQPEMKVADDGTYCEISKGVQSRNVVTGKFSMGRSDLDIELRGYNGGMVLMLIKGRIVPDAGGRETQVDCNMLYNGYKATVPGLSGAGNARAESWGLVGCVLLALLVCVAW